MAIKGLGGSLPLDQRPSCATLGCDTMRWRHAAGAAGAIAAAACAHIGCGARSARSIRTHCPVCTGALSTSQHRQCLPLQHSSTALQRMHGAEPDPGWLACCAAVLRPALANQAARKALLLRDVLMFTLRLRSKRECKWLRGTVLGIETAVSCRRRHGALVPHGAGRGANGMRPCLCEVSHHHFTQNLRQLAFRGSPPPLCEHVCLCLTI